MYKVNDLPLLDPIDHFESIQHHFDVVDFRFLNGRNWLRPN